MQEEKKKSYDFPTSSVQRLFLKFSPALDDTMRGKMLLFFRTKRKKRDMKVEEVNGKVIVMFQNDKTAIYEFIFIDHIVFIFTTFVKEFKQVNALGMTGKGCE